MVKGKADTICEHSDVYKHTCKKGSKKPAHIVQVFYITNSLCLLILPVVL